MRYDKVQLFVRTNADMKINTNHSNEGQVRIPAIDFFMAMTVLSTQQYIQNNRWDWLLWQGKPEFN